MPEIDRFETWFGTMFHHADDEVIGQSLKRYGQWAIDEIGLIAHIMRLQPLGDFLDLGANIGVHTVAIATLFPGRRVLALEANPRSFQLLCTNITANGLGNAQARHVLVGAESRTCRVTSNEAIRPRNLGAVAFDVLPPGEPGGQLLLQAAVDDLFPPDRKAAFLKLDLEGMEAVGLAGAQAVLARCRPAVYFENGRQSAQGAIFDQLAALGYETFWHINFPFDEHNFRGEPSNTFGNAVEIATLAIHKQAAGLDGLRSQLIPTDKPVGERGWHQCAALNQRLRAEVKRLPAQPELYAVLRHRALGEADAAAALKSVAEAGALPGFADLRRALLLDIPGPALRAMLRPLIELAPLDEPAYLRRHPDVAAAVAAQQFRSAREHYVVAGYFEGRQLG